MLYGGRKTISLKIVNFVFSSCLFIPGNKLSFNSIVVSYLFPDIPLYWLRCLQLLYFSLWLLAIGRDAGWKHLSAGCEESKVSPHASADVDLQGGSFYWLQRGVWMTAESGVCFSIYKGFLV